MMHSAAPKLLVITGPTATGKTALGVKLAKLVDGEVVSADSMQIYKNMDIGTAKPTTAEMDGIVHHMIDIVPPQEDYSVARYVTDAASCVDDILSRGKQPIIVGGSGLYIDSLIRGRVFSPPGNPSVRQQLENQYDELGGEVMLSKLKALDASSAAKLHKNDRKRIVRAFEVAMSSEAPISLHDTAEKSAPPRYLSIKIALTFADRAVLYERIERRVDAMVSAGLIDEVVALVEKGVPRTCTSMQAIGYKEIAEALDKKTDMAAAAQKIKTESKRYAKRQLTWLRRDDSIIWITWDAQPDIEGGADIISKLSV